ncbi:MAG TPA: SAM-dependent methyltransferase, partial [Dehalococcoidia bacterium]|nr:SAM-dependent methyltransferase [Dehalococcoidia bacterium]
MTDATLQAAFATTSDVAASCAATAGVLPRLPARLRAVRELLPAGARRVADVGAGHGALSAHVAARGCRVIAV